MYADGPSERIVQMRLFDSALVEPAPVDGFGVKKYHVPILHVQVHHTVQFLVCQIDDSKVRQIDKVTLRVRMRS